MGGINLVFAGDRAVHADVVEPHRDMFLAEVEGVAKFVPESRKLYVPGPSLAGVRKAVGIRGGAISGNIKVSFQAARSIG